MTLRRTILGGALVLLPALIIGAVAWRLARHEEERLRRAAVEAARTRLRAVAFEIESVVAATRRAAHARLRALPAEGRIEALRAWQQTDPLVRNVFLLNLESGRLYLPDRALGVTSDEAEFLRVFEPLFAGRAPWTAPPAEEEAVRPRGAPAEGWLAWFAGESLRPLAWARLDGEWIAGVEIELTALLSRLLPLLPAPEREGEAYALLDGSEGVAAQSGGTDIAAGARLVEAVPLGASLPHWRAGWYAAPSSGAGTAPGARLALRLMVLATVATLLAGGGVLLRESWRNALDARRKTTFVSNVSHELKTPLTTIRMYAELLGEGRVTDAGQRAQYLGVIASESERLGRLIANVLDFSRLEQGRKKYRIKRQNVAEAARAVIERERLRFETAGMRVESRLPDEAAVRFDRDALEQALLNLLDNALKYGRTGGTVEVALEREGARWRLDVLDRGPGVPPEHRERIFEAFHRVDDSITATATGVGLGLSIARRLARDLDGDAIYRPRPGGGAWFSLYLPAEETA